MKVTFFDCQEEDNPLNGSQLVNGEETLNLLERLKLQSTMSVKRVRPSDLGK